MKMFYIKCQTQIIKRKQNTGTRKNKKKRRSISYLKSTETIVF